VAVAQGSLLLAAGAVLLCQCGAPDGGAHQEVIQEGQFGQLRLFQPPSAPRRHLVLLLSGVVAGAPGSMPSPSGPPPVARSWPESTCARGWPRSDTRPPPASPPGPLAQLGRSLQARYALQERPALVGHSAGATLAYVALAQGRAQDFRGAVTLSFYAGLDLAKPLCAAPTLFSTRRSSGIRLAPGGALPAPWIGLHGLEDRECPAAEGRAFMQAVPGASFVPLPGEGHAYGDIDSWWARFRAAYGSLATAQGPGTPPP